MLPRYLMGELPLNKVYMLEDINFELIDLNTLNVPNYEDYNLQEYPTIAASVSRGCIFKCSFCAETQFWKEYHRKEVQKAVDELTELYEKYGRRLFVLTDCLINPLVTQLAEELIQQKKDFYWDVTLKIDKQVCNAITVERWRQGGFYRARLGVESGSQQVLDMIDKKITVDQIRTSLKNLASAGIKTTTYWIAGHPGETEKDFQMTLDLLTELKDYIYEAECDPFRYYYTGQVNSEEWSNVGRSFLYPEEAKDMLIVQTWQLNTEPSREVMYERGWWFKEHCKKLGIPNPYSISEIYQADERWKSLHDNAAPSFLSFL